jgi:hypothetical protein
LKDDRVGQSLKRLMALAEPKRSSLLASRCRLDLEIVHLQQPLQSNSEAPGKYHHTIEGSPSRRSSIFWSASTMILWSLMTSYNSTDPKSSMQLALS